MPGTCSFIGVNIIDEFFILCYDDSMQHVYRPPKLQTVPTQRRRRIFPLLMLNIVGLAFLLGLRLFPSASAQEPSLESLAPPTPPVVEAEATVSAVDSASMFLMDNGEQPLVGIVSGHRGYDPGAVCDDGLMEVDINYGIASEVIDLLRRRGIRADLLDEYDARLTDYQADALVSIHADSCIAGVTGFKVARVTESAIPEAEDLLVACLNQEYTVYTGLPQHPGSITDNMTNYHAFNEIAPLTPGAIIETGFMYEDRFLLESRPKIVARGIAAGILCFLNYR